MSFLCSRLYGIISVRHFVREECNASVEFAHTFLKVALHVKAKCEMGFLLLPLLEIAHIQFFIMAMIIVKDDQVRSL